MDYGPDSSGAYPQDVAPALRDYFGYSADDSVSRSGYTADAWMSKLRDDLDESRPVFYGGYGTGGHAFVCDGYLSSGDYFHFNWGWDGYADGYFLLNDLTPGGGDFNDGQAAVFGIEPEDDDGGILLDVLTQNYYAGNYDAYASYYGGLALAGYSAYRYYAYLYAYYVYLYGYQAYALSPSGSYTQTAAYSAFLYAYYRYLYAVYDYVYGGYGYYVLVYDLYGDLYRANVNLYATQGR
jgi:hypothetical protein